MKKYKDDKTKDEILDEMLDGYENDDDFWDNLDELLG